MPFSDIQNTDIFKSTALFKMHRMTAYMVVYSISFTAYMVVLNPRIVRIIRLLSGRSRSGKVFATRKHWPAMESVLRRPFVSRTL